MGKRFSKSSEDARGREPVSWEHYLRDSAIPCEIIDHFLNGPNWAQFDPELGYTLQNSLIPWGIDGSHTIETFQAHGARSAFLYSARSARINSYGNSFTECEQVNDGETWQEYLAGHFGEPIGNYGVGGYGVYQAYRRMLRHEETEHGADCVILYVWGDDAVRSLQRARWPVIYSWFFAQENNGYLFHGNCWPNLEMDLATGRLVEKDNPLPTRESQYKMCDPEWMVQAFHDDLAAQLDVYANMSPTIIDLDRNRIERLAQWLEFDFDWRSDAERRSQARKLLNLYGQRAACRVLDRARAFTRSCGKKLLVLLNYTARNDAYTDEGEPYDGVRKDEEILDYLTREGFDYFDMNAVHQHEYEKAQGSYRAYIDQYHVAGGHYNPRGNHLFAYAIKDKLLELLDPKPLPYRNREAGKIDFDGYLPK